MYTPTLASVLTLQYLFFYGTQLKCVNLSVNTQKTYVGIIKEVLYNLFLLYITMNLFH